MVKLVELKEAGISLSIPSRFKAEISVEGRGVSVATTASWGRVTGIWVGLITRQGKRDVVPFTTLAPMDNPSVAWGSGGSSKSKSSHRKSSTSG